MSICPSSGARMQRHTARRANARNADHGRRIAARAAVTRAAHRPARNAERRARPEIVVRPDFLPLAIH